MMGLQKQSPVNFSTRTEPEHVQSLNISPWLVHDLSENSNRVVVAHVLEVDFVHLVAEGLKKTS